MFDIAREVIRPELRYHMSRLAPNVFCKLHQFNNGKASRSVADTTEVVIEGFPRSANTYLVQGFLQTQERSVSVAHHLHLPVNVHQGIKKNIPCLVMIRRPTEAVTSLVGMRMQKTKISQSVQKEYNDRFLIRRISQAAKHWIRFYKDIMSYKHGYLLVTFEQAIHKPSTVLKNMNKCFGKRYHTHVPAESIENSIQHDYNEMYTPSYDRDRIKQRLVRIAKHRKAYVTMRYAEDLYDYLVNY